MASQCLKSVEIFQRYLNQFPVSSFLWLNIINNHSLIVLVLSIEDLNFIQDVLCSLVSFGGNFTRGFELGGELSCLELP